MKAPAGCLEVRPGWERAGTGVCERAYQVGKNWGGAGKVSLGPKGAECFISDCVMESTVQWEWAWCGVIAAFQVPGR